jgi:signal transduction histidine kinase
MDRVLFCLTQEHDLRLVVVAGMVCLFASLTAISLFSYAAEGGQARRWMWLAAIGVVTGTGVWATHFIAMLAFDPGLDGSYDILMTALSVVIAMVMTGSGFAIALICRDRPWAIPAGGLLIGLGIVAMHYTGMAGLRLPASIEYESGLVSASIGISVGLSCLALWAASLGGELKRQLGATVLLTLAICGLHFTAMGSVGIIPNPYVEIHDQGMPEQWLAVVVTITAVFILAAGFISALVDRRFALQSEREATRLRAMVAELEETKGRLERTAADLTKALDAAAAGSQAKSQFLAAMSHELRTPLNAVIGFADVLVEGSYGALNDKQREYLGNVRDAGAHLLALVNDVLDLSILDAATYTLDRDALYLKETIAGAVAMVSPRAATAGVRLERAALTDLPIVFGDVRRIRQVLLNLLTNAIKFTPSGGKVSVSASRQGAFVAVVVADSGIGMAPADIPRALERFGQIDNKLTRGHEGAGLGLPLSKRIVEIHGGTLSIASVLDRGTTVTFTIPVGRAAAQAA